MYTGNALLAQRALQLALDLVLTAAVAVRVFGPASGTLDYRTIVILTGTLWTIAFTLYVVVYAPILVCPRADGRPG